MSDPNLTHYFLSTSEQSSEDSNQFSFNFFWPLTEQISLDLDYAKCSVPRSGTYIIPPIDLKKIK
jgi:hypothetical protein